MSKIENNRIELDRVSVIKSLADALDVSLGDLLAEPSLMEWTAESGNRTVSGLRAALLDYRAITPFSSRLAPPPSLETLRSEVADLWSGYQAARFAYVTSRLPLTLERAQTATDAYTGTDAREARRLLGLAYQLAATQLTKLGEVELAWIAADRGLSAVRPTGDAVVIGSLYRSVGHALHAAGRFAEAVQLTHDAAAYLEPHMRHAGPDLLSVYGTLFLAGSMAAARANDPSTTRSFLTAADKAAARLGRDANYLWTAFGPTNVAIHRVATAAELGDLQVAVDLGPKIDTHGLPMERRVRHALEVARVQLLEPRRRGACRRPGRRTNGP